MNEVSIGTLRLPQTRSARVGEKIAREAIFRLLSKLQVGSLTLHEGPCSHHFGSVDKPHEPQAEVHIHSPAVYSQMLTGGSIGSGEAYMKGYWSSPDAMDVMRIFSANLVLLNKFDASQSVFVKLALKIAHRFNRNTYKGSQLNIAAHYDLGNEFFQLFLDPTMMYSSALFSDKSASLEVASETKLDELCQQLELKSDDHLLEIGTGWGGMAIHAAKNFGCRVTTTTISQEQYDFASARVREEGLEGQITLLCEDYRNLTGEYDKLVSIEMIEAVGHDFYQNYFRMCSGLLKPNGKMVIQAITMADQRYKEARDSVDFIKRYIFPGGCLPSVAVMAQHIARDTDMQIVHLRDITNDYAETLAHWRQRFLANLEAVRGMGFSEEFVRMWDFYLCYCEGGFRERVISTVQLAFAKPDYRFQGSVAPVYE
ncbi:MAG: cyclopropane-fatty-acyl-phospholipid synthase family protein [Halioglobus sp.]|mgnify:FL=1|jgi:cyclopropane-fatty-acyl-phospholipid synthase|uniref:class I SAM-dependent methyltransferase n=1 Tax=Halioglobus sp. Uisw_031 TaxID=3230977 RepID=UPI003591D75C